VLPPPLATATGLLPFAATIPDNVDASALCPRLEAIIKEAEDAEEKAAATAHRCVQAARLLLEEEETKAAALEQMATATRQHVPSSSLSSPPSAS
jgi:hypothetical protein